MKVKPMYDRILIKRLETESTSPGGIVIPDTAKEKTTKGEVIAVGKGKVLKDGSLKPPAVQQGQKVLFEKWGGTEIKIEGEEHVVLREDDILGIID
ncbi:co-chaperone GroES [Acidobacteriota bacterium]